MILAVFGDVHGNLPGMEDLVGRWECSRSQNVRAILLAGDVSVFPDKNRVDGATRRHADRDPTELWTSRYLSGELEPRWPIYFCRGNHEDHLFLRRHQNQAVDPSGKLVYWAGGDIHELVEGGSTVRIATIGGIQPPWEDPFTDPKGRRFLPERYFDREELKRAETWTPGSTDVLLSHDGPFGLCLQRKPEAGSRFLTRLIEKLQPRFHFYGHYGHPPPPTKIGRTWVAPLNQESVVRVPLRDGGMGILDTGSWQFEFVFDVENTHSEIPKWGILRSE